MRRVLDDAPDSIAIVRLRTGLGDLLCTIPALRALRAKLPSAHVVLITFEEMHEVVDRTRPWVDELLPFPGYPGIPERPPQDAEIPRFFAAARARRFDLALQMYGANPTANEVTERLGAKRTAGFFVPGTWEPDLATHLPYPHHEHEIRRHLLLMRHLGAALTDGDAGRGGNGKREGDALTFPLRSSDRLSAGRLAEEVGLRAPYALVHPGATSPSRRWPPERFAVVADWLVRRGLQVAIIGTSDERALVRRVHAAVRGATVELCGRTDLGTLAALVADAEVVVGNDSGPAHLAAAVGTRSVTLFLSGDPVRWAHDLPAHRVARVQVECNPCPHLNCPIDHRCATRLDVRRVVAEVDAALGRTMRAWSSGSDTIGST
jgi:ADP-heptose:LPS heptosyltransferase